MWPFCPITDPRGPIPWLTCAPHVDFGSSLLYCKRSTCQNKVGQCHGIGSLRKDLHLTLKFSCGSGMKNKNACSPCRVVVEDYLRSLLSQGRFYTVQQPVAASPMIMPTGPSSSAASPDADFELAGTADSILIFQLLSFLQSSQKFVATAADNIASPPNAKQALPAFVQVFEAPVEQVLPLVGSHGT